jgi:hypothetical protein
MTRNLCVMEFAESCGKVRKATSTAVNCQIASNSQATLVLSKARYTKQIIKLVGNPAIAGTVQEKSL